MLIDDHRCAFIESSTEIYYDESEGWILFISRTREEDTRILINYCPGCGMNLEKNKII